ncbi:MAG: RNA polymerase sigma factor [Actinomycetota bacterium]|jgi:RNA polymerase sigma-70 factor (ECF subfamily)|nr:RNA polymerase sigma factor [Actinomycetota bacterium]
MARDQLRVDREAAFVALFDAHYGKILAFATRRIGPDIAKDVVADTFVTAWLRLEDLRGDPLVWLYGLARGALANHRRRLLRAQHLSDRAERLSAPREGGDPADDVAWRDSFASAFGQLAETDREVLRLVAWEGLDTDAAAAVLGCSAGAFKVRLYRARRRLRRYLRLDSGVTRAMRTTDPAGAVTPKVNPPQGFLAPAVSKELPCP